LQSLFIQPDLTEKGVSQPLPPGRRTTRFRFGPPPPAAVPVCWIPEPSDPVVTHLKGATPSRYLQEASKFEQNRRQKQPEAEREPAQAHTQVFDKIIAEVFKFIDSDLFAVNFFP